MGDRTPIEPADPGDDRVDVLVVALRGQQWRGWSLRRLSAHLLVRLDEWQRQRNSMESQLRRLLDER